MLVRRLLDRLKVNYLAVLSRPVLRDFLGVWLLLTERGGYKNTL